MQGGGSIALLVALKDFQYRLFNAAEPARPPEINIPQKETGLQKKAWGVFPKNGLCQFATKNKGGTPESIDILRVRSLA